MSRLTTTTDRIEVKPTINVYTALVAVATVVAIIGLYLINSQMVALFGEGLLGK